MPELLATELTREHADELARLEAAELRRLRKVYEQARQEILGRLSELKIDTFTAQHHRVALAQVEAGLAAMRKKLRAQVGRRLEGAIEDGLRQLLEEISYFDRTFRGGASGRIQLAALRNVAAPGGLLLEGFQKSIDAYGLNLVREIQGRLGVHLVKRSSWRDVTLDVAGQLEQNMIQGARWRAERIVRTELVSALNAGKQAGLERAVRLVPGLRRQWDSTLDTRTSEVCQTLNGQVRDLHEPWRFRGEEIARPPARPNCRAVVIPWHSEWTAAAAA